MKAGESGVEEEIRNDGYPNDGLGFGSYITRDIHLLRSVDISGVECKPANRYVEVRYHELAWSSCFGGKSDVKVNSASAAVSAQLRFGKLRSESP